MIFYGRFNKRTEHGRAMIARCMNCLKEGHTSNYCKEKMMCPHCSEEHQADKCPSKGLITTSCTACARHTKSVNPSLDLKQLFAKTPVGLRHSPLDPTCPTRIAGEIEQERRATIARERLTAEANKNPGTAPVNQQPGTTTRESGEQTSPVAVEGEKDTVTMEDFQC